MIAPDTKDWTWVVDRLCPECRFDASVCRAVDVAALTLLNAADWQRLGQRGAIRPGRPDAATWSSLEYACHVRDVHRIYDERIALMLRDDNPLFPNWDQDASADDERYDEQDPATVVSELIDSAKQLATRLDAIAGDEWERTGRRSDGATFTLQTIVRYMVHDPIHHIWDVRRTAL